MPDHPEIYRKQADQYEALVSREDYQQHLLPALEKITSFRNRSVVELGAGTGRITCQLAPLANFIYAFDSSPHMLELAIEKLKKSGFSNWQAKVADHRQVPVADQTADILISGWSVCYVVVDNPEAWQVELDKVFREIERILRPEGRIILVETMGTGFTQPTPPAHLLEYYAYLQALGFQQTWIRTDYRFETLEIAQSLTQFFFGAEMIEKIEQKKGEIILPECTGIWWK